MSEYAWPIVVALAVVLGFITSMRYLSRSEAKFATAGAYHALSREVDEFKIASIEKVKGLADDFHAFTAAVEVKVAALEAEQKRVAAVATADGRFPAGLRRQG